ncbi:hypothetical protein, partial [uncultured Xanthomonas sp.]
GASCPCRGRRTSMYAAPSGFFPALAAASEGNPASQKQEQPQRQKQQQKQQPLQLHLQQQQKNQKQKQR